MSAFTREKSAVKEAACGFQDLLVPTAAMRAEFSTVLGVATGPASKTGLGMKQGRISSWGMKSESRLPGGVGARGGETAQGVTGGKGPRGQRHRGKRWKERVGKRQSSRES